LFEFAQHILIAWWPFWVLLGIAIALILLLRTWASPERMPYMARGQLVTKSELRFYKALVKAVQDDWEIFAMVRIADLLRVEKGHKNHRKWLNKILAKHIDFVLCHPGTLVPEVCIELDDPSHNRPDRIERDIFVNAAFDAADLPLLRIPTEPSYRARDIRDMIDEVVNYLTFMSEKSASAGGNWGAISSSVDRSSSLTTRLRYHLRSDGMMCQGAWSVEHCSKAAS